MTKEQAEELWQAIHAVTVKNRRWLIHDKDGFFRKDACDAYDHARLLFIKYTGHEVV